MVLHHYDPMRVAAVVPEKEEGSFVTPAIDLSETDLVMDADAAEGWIEVELLEADGQPAPGFYPTRFEETSDTAILLSWENFTSTQIPMTECRLRITLHNATLYAIKNFGQ
jgi:hypothetical protein